VRTPQKCFMLAMSLFYCSIVQAETDCNKQSQIPPKECETLVQLFKDTGGEDFWDEENEWNQDGWNHDQEPCSWFGITCEGGYVTKIALDYYSKPYVWNLKYGFRTKWILKGAIPDLSQLKNLKVAIFSENRLSSFSGLPEHLEGFYADKNWISDIPDLSNVYLKVLSLAHNNLSGAIEGSIFSNTLTRLDLSYNGLTDQPDLGNKSQLKKLNLASNQIRDIYVDFLPQSLTELNLSANPIGVFPDLKEKIHLRNLDLSSIGLTETFDSSFLPLSLKVLDLSYNQLTHLPNLNRIHLKRLEVSGNQLSENIPSSYFPNSLVALYLDGNQLTTLPDLSHTQLTTLDAQSNQLIENIPGSYFPNSLITLDLDNNQLKTLPDLNHTQLTTLSANNNQLTTANIPGSYFPISLTKLYLNNNQLEKLPNLSHTRLRILYVSNNQLTENTAPGAHFPGSLTELGLSSNQFKTFPDLSHTGIEGLWASNNQLTGDTPGIYFPLTLKKITLNGNALKKIPDFSSTQLELLIIWDNVIPISMTQVELLPSSLEWLDLSNNQLSGSINAIAGLTALEHLDLSNNELTGSVSVLDNLTSLRYANLHHNKLTGKLPHLTDLTQLDKLYLSDNQLTGSIPNLGHLTTLNRLSLGNNQLDGTIPDLRNLVKLEYLDLSCNQLEGYVLPYFAELLEKNLYVKLRGNNLKFSADAKLFIAIEKRNVQGWDEQTGSCTPNYGSSHYYSSPLPEQILAFKSSLIGTPVKAYLTVGNQGDDHVAFKITAAHISGQQAGNFSIITEISESNPLWVIPQKQVRIELSCTPSNVGLHEAELTIETTDTEIPSATFPLVCIGVEPAGYLSDPPPNSTLNIGAQKVGHLITQTFSVSKQVDSDLTAEPVDLSLTSDLEVDFVGISGEHADEFAVLLPGFPLKIADEDKPQAVKIRCIPEGDGLRTATLQLSSSDPENPNPSYPLECEGSCYQTAAYSQTIDFGRAPLGSYYSKDYRLEWQHYCGQTELASLPQIVGTDSADFTLEQPPECQYGENTSSCTFKVAFSPTSMGSKEAQLAIEFSDPRFEPIQLPLQAQVVTNCDDNKITLASAVSEGVWSDPQTWGSAGQLPTVDDIVQIRAGHTITLDQDVEVKALCVQSGATLISPDQHGSSLTIRASDYLENQGQIIAQDGQDESGQCTQESDLNTGDCAYAGANILLKVGSVEKVDWGWFGESGPIMNRGDIIAGAGGSGCRYSAAGGRVILLGRNVTNEGTVQAGQGGELTCAQTGKTGAGGLVEIWGNVGSPGHLLNTGALIAGDGGACVPNAEQSGGNGGDVVLMSKPRVRLEDGVQQAGQASADCRTVGEDGEVVIDPNAIQLAGALTQIEGGNIWIYGGHDWTLDLSQLNNPIATATGNITLAVGENGIIDLSGNQSIILSAPNGRVSVFTDNLVLDDNVALSDLITAAEIITAPSTIIRRVSLIAPEKLTAQAGATLPMQLTVANSSPEVDTYTLAVTTESATITGLPTSLKLEGLQIVDLNLEITMPLTPETILINATSQSDPQATAHAAIQLVATGTPQVNEPLIQPAPVLPEPEVDETPIVEETPVIEEVVTEPTPTPQEPVPSIVEVPPVITPPPGSIPVLINCPPTGTIDYPCRNYGQVLTDAVLIGHANVAGGRLAGTIDNQGLVSQVVVETGAQLTGGKLSGYIVNQGTLEDITFVGAELQGGQLAGTIVNASRIAGTLVDVTFAAHTQVRGGYIQGDLQGNPQAPALLNHLTVRPQSHLNHVIIGDNVQLLPPVTLGDEVQFLHPTPRRSKPHNHCDDSLPTLGAVLISRAGHYPETQADYSGGVGLNDAQLIERTMTVSLTDSVHIQACLAPAGNHQPTEMVVYARYRSEAGAADSYYMLTAEGQVLPWDQQIAHLVTFKPFEPGVYTVYSGQLVWPGLVEFYLGYRLSAEQIVMSAQPIELIVTE